jgi:quercetin dioxygenase-like cupin family protein
MPSDTTDRLRPHPTTRFAASHQVIDLQAAAADLAAEARSSPQRHRQKTLSRFGTTTVALFHFEKGSSMPEHVAHGTVSLHILEGRMSLQAEGKQHSLAAGQILVLAPGVPHDLHADEDSRMLMTLHLEPAESNE